MLAVQSWIVRDDVLPFGLVVAAALVGLVLARWILYRIGSARGGDFRAELTMLLLTAAAGIAVLLALPIEATLRGQVLGFVGIVLSAAIALSSTTFLGNALAGVMLRAVRNFGVGDWLRVDDEFGRVTERGLMHVEIQTEDRDLTTLPNLYLVTRPVKVVRRSGTVVSADVSLGYDVAHGRAEDALLEAAGRAELEEPFVQLRELGDFSVTYRVAGMLTDVDRMISARSGLRREMLDALHDAGIEVLSPTYMNTLAREPGESVVPVERSRRPEPERPPEEVVFDKAREASDLEERRKAVEELDAAIADAEARESAADGEAAEALGREVEHMKAERTRLADDLERRLEEAQEREESD